MENAKIEDEEEKEGKRERREGVNHGKNETARDGASSRGQFVHNVNCRNYYDIIIHPNCTANRHAKCLIASSGGGTGAEEGRGAQRVETVGGEKGTCN